MIDHSGVEGQFSVELEGYIQELILIDLKNKTATVNIEKNALEQFSYTVANTQSKVKVDYCYDGTCVYFMINNKLLYVYPLGNYEIDTNGTLYIAFVRPR